MPFISVITWATTSELVAFYSLEDNAANSAVDDAHTAVGPYDGVVVNDETNYSSEQTIAAKVSNGFDLDGTNDYVTITGGSITQTATLQAWVQPDSTAAEQILVYVGDGTITGGGADHHVLGIDNSGRAFILTQRGSAGGRATGTTNMATDGTWYHVVGVCRATNDREIYVNNSSEGTNTGSEPISGTMTTWSIGAYSNGTNPYNGTLDEIGVWSDGLTTGEISTLYGGGSGLAYPFSGGGATGAQIIIISKLFVDDPLQKAA
jgi:hypothetical protein